MKQPYESPKPVDYGQIAERSPGALTVSGVVLFTKRHSKKTEVTFKHKLSVRLAMIRDVAVVLTAAAVFACALEDRTLAPDRLSLAVATSQPGTVTDLAVTATADTAVTLVFADVGDSAGRPASYVVRFAVAPLAWGSASDASQGTCAVPIAGTTIGSNHSCTVLGLQPGTTYEFQLAAFQGTLNRDAVFGGLSNIARATTNERTTAAPPDTVFGEGFESGNLNAWQDGVDGTRQRVLNDPALAHSGSYVLEVTDPAGSNGGWLTRWFMPGYDSLYVSYWLRLAPNWQGGTKLLGLYGSRTDDQWSAMGKAGICPTGTDFFAALLVTEPAGSPGPLRFYTYYPAMAREPDGVTCWGRYGNGSEAYVPPLELSLDAWHRVEFWVKLNTPGAADATQTVWLDGVQRGRWSGLSLRSSTILRLNSVQLTFNAGISGAPQTQKLYVDDIVVSTRQPSAVASVAMSPASGSVQVGQVLQLTATPLDASGNVLGGRTVTWATSNAAVATVSGTGLVTAVAAGAATISAMSEGVQGMAAVTVTNHTSTEPGTVTDLTVSAATDTSVTLAFTEVNDGTGKPASYDIRLAAGTLSWGSAAEVTGGSCASPGAGTAIGVMRSCSVFGLAASTAYQFQVVAFRGNLNVNAVFGALSNVAGDTTTGSTPPPGGAWPNEPAGLTVRTDWGLDQVLPTAGDVPIPGSPGWHVVYGFVPGPANGWAQLVADPTAPFSTTSVYDFVYPQGMVEGTAPATVYYPNLGTREVYVGFWWKPSAPFDFGPNGNKIAFLFNSGGGAGGQQFIILLPDGRLHVLPEYPGDYRWRDPNVTSTVVTLGQWHRVEWYCNLATGALQWWLDGVLQGSYSDVSNGHAFDMFQFSPTWGGNSGAQKRETDHYWFDHLHLSVR
jgi:hypothetical protein